MAEDMKCSLATQCMDFSKHLASQGHYFKLTLKTDSFNFQLDIMKIGHPVTMFKKKSSPSTLTRNTRRREELLARKKYTASCDSEKEVTALDSPVAKSNSDKVTEEQEEECVLKQDTFSCNMCNYNGNSSVGMTIHKSRKHKNISQLDGETSIEQDTDCWWEKHFTSSIKVFQVYKEVLMDIKESTLNEDEKCREEERVNQARKEAFGDNFSFFPPWSNT